MTSTEHPEAALARRPLRYAIDPAGSSATFSVRKFGLFTVRGGFGPVSGELRVDGDRVHGNGTVRVEAIDTGIARRDSHLRSPHFFHADEHAELRLEVEGALLGPDPVPVEAHATVKGERYRVGLLAHRHLAADGALHLHARGRLDRRGLGITPPWFLDRVMVGNDVELELDLVARPA